MNGASGIAGEVILRPVSPVEGPGMPTHRPCEAGIRIMDENGRTVAECRSGPDGRFRADLPPGAYVLHAEPDVAGPRAPPQTVTVEKKRFTAVRIVVDSGIR